MSLLNDFFLATMNIMAGAIVAIFIENTIFSRALGTSTMILVVTKDISKLIIGIILTFITLTSAIISYFTLPFVNKLPSKGAFLPLVYILIITIVYILALFINSRFKKATRVKIKPLIHILAFNCTVLGALYLMSQDSTTLPEFIGFGLGTGIGFMLATFLLDVAYERLNASCIPKSFAGKPIIFIYIGILSLAFYGLIGHHLSF